MAGFFEFSMMRVRGDIEQKVLSEVIKTATHHGVGICYCRHKMQHMDRACSDGSGRKKDTV
jgi:hypothetical protein